MVHDMDGHSESSATRVLLVEDDPRDALLIREMLRSTWTEGLVFSHVERLSDAAQELVDHSASCVLLDLSLPDGDGLLALGHVRTAAPNTRPTSATGSASTTTRRPGTTPARPTGAACR